MGEENNGKMYVKFEGEEWQEFVGEEWQEFVGVQEVQTIECDNNPRFGFYFPMFEKALEFSCNSWSVFGTMLIEEIANIAPNKKVAHLIRHGKYLTKKKNIKRAICKKENGNESSND